MTKQTRGQQPPRQMTKRQRARWEREQMIHVRLLMVVGGAMVFAILAVIGAVVWDRVITPNRAVAQVGGEKITRKEYQLFREISLAQQIAQAREQVARYEQFLGQLDPSQQEAFSAQVGQQRQQAEQTQQIALTELRGLATEPINYISLDQMIEDQLILQGAARENKSISDDEVNAELAESLVSTDPTTPTETLTGTDTLTGTTAVSPTAVPTLTPSEATSSVEANLRDYYNNLVNLVQQLQTSTGLGRLDLNFTAEDFISYVRNQQRVQMLRDRIEEELVTEAPKTQQVRVQHILLSVTTAPTDTDEVKEQAYADVKVEADRLYEQLRGGADFDALARERSDDPGSKENGGVLDWASPDTYVEEFKQASLSQPIGEIGRPVRTQFGWHIIKVLGREERPDEAKLNTARSEAFEKWLEEQRATLQVQRFPEPTPLPTAPPAPSTPTTPLTGTQELTPTAPITR